MLGYAVHDIFDFDFEQMVLAVDRERVLAELDAAINSDKSTFFIQYRVEHKKTGTVIWIGDQAHIQRDNNGNAIKIFGHMFDITEQKQNEEKLHLAAKVYSHSHDGIVVTDKNRAILHVNQAFTKITGYSLEDIQGKNPRILKSGRQGASFYKDLWATLDTQGYWQGELQNKRKDGSLYSESLTISVIKDSHGDVINYVGIFSDISDVKQYQKQLERVVHYDSLTHLPNRVLLCDCLHKAMSQTQRRRVHMAVVYLDLDNFKTINDRHGHDIGDKLLINVAKQLKLSLREGDTIARLGGDEFVAVLMDIDGIENCKPLLDRLQEAASGPIQVDSLTLQLTSSLGVTYFPQQEEVNSDTLIRQSDQAMYKAKLSGKNKYLVFDSEKDRHARGRHLHLERIGQALEDEEFVLFYQPKVNMRSGELIGMEALIRWQHPENGILPPIQFLPTIENHVLAIKVGEWVISTALHQIQTWQEMGLNIPVSINLGAEQLQQENFVERLKNSLGEHPEAVAKLLTLEILETSALEDVEHVSRVMTECQDLGVFFSLDDFGTGYSSLTYLKKLPAVEIKIDQSFVRDMLNDPNDLAILEGVLGLALAFNRKTVAEGVETIAHGEMLLQLGCIIGQGYSIARPMPAEEVIQWKAAWKPDPLWVEAKKINRADLPLLFSGTEHRHWILMLEEYLNDERKTAPPMDHEVCHFGKWLNSSGATHYQGNPAMADVDRLHKQIHGLACEIIQLKKDKKGADVLAKLHELYDLRDNLLANLKRLLS